MSGSSQVRFAYSKHEEPEGGKREVKQASLVVCPSGGVCDEPREEMSLQSAGLKRLSSDSIINTRAVLENGK